MTISLIDVPKADPNKPPLNKESSVLSSVGVNTPSSSNGINSTNALSGGKVLKVKDVSTPSPLNTSDNLFLVLSAVVT